jgi:hypothetical protein
MKVRRDDLISPEYLEQNRILHRGKGGFGGSGWKHADAIIAFYNELDCKSALDYGCGERTLLREFSKRKVKIPLQMYDPGIPKYATMPSPQDLVICTDVLEHVEPEKLDAVLDHISSLSRKGCYLAIATRAANRLLPNGRNAHAIIEDTPWWKHRLKRMTERGLFIVKHDDIRKGGVPTGAPHELRVWLKR